LAGLGGADADGLVGHQDGARPGVRLRVGDHRADAHLAAGAEDTQRDLAAIGNKNLVEHGQAADKGPSASLAPSAAGSTYREYASPAAVGRRLAAGPFSTPCSVISLAVRLHEEERLTELDRLGVLDEYLHDAPGQLRLDLVHELHGFDDAEGLPLLDRIPLADERRRLGIRGAVEGANHGCLDRHRAGEGLG